MRHAVSNKASPRAGVKAAAPVPGRALRPAVVAQAAATAETAWDAWTSYMSARKAAPSKIADWHRDIAETMKATADTYKPKLTLVPEVSNTFKWTHTESVPKQLPADLHDRLETLGFVALRQALGLDEAAPLDCATVSMTTTDIDAGVCISGLVVQSGMDKTAYVAVVATEVERQASWSRLEGLILHWACSEAPGAAWHLPPQGWKAIPNKVADAGGAWQCTFEKLRADDKNEPVYEVVLQLPLRGVLKSGGITFVLKATAGQNTRWLKDECTRKDFFLDLGKLPITKV